MVYFTSLRIFKSAPAFTRALATSGLFFYFLWGKIFVSSEFLGSSWKNVRGCGILNHTPVLCGTVSWVKISWFASQPRKPRKFYPPKNTRYTVYTGVPRKFYPPEKYPIYGIHRGSATLHVLMEHAQHSSYTCRKNETTHSI